MVSAFYHFYYYVCTSDSKIKNLMVSDSQIRTTAFVLLLVLVLFRIVHFIPAFYSLFDGFVGMKTLNRGSFVSENICSLLINLWIFGLFIYLSNLLRGKNAANLKSGIFPAIATGFYTFYIWIQRPHFRGIGTDQGCKS